jgi:hypothetical protein
VHLHILQGNPIGAREIAFHGLAARNERGTSELIRLCKWFAFRPTQFKQPDGKRRPVDQQLLKKGTPEALLELFGDLFPEDARTIKDVSSHRLFVKSD